MLENEVVAAVVQHSASNGATAISGGFQRSGANRMERMQSQAERFAGDGYSHP
jgi:hypothetical protein